MAFIRPGAGGMALFVLPLTSQLTPEGPPQRITADLPFIRTVAWTPDGRGLVFSAAGHMSVAPRLYTIVLTPDRLKAAGRPELPAFGENGDSFSISRTGRLVYTAFSRDMNLWRLALSGPDRFKPERLTLSTYDEYIPDYAPDSQRLAFTSTQTGAEEIWVAKADGSEPLQMTSIGGAVCANARWSPDGEKILFHSASRDSTRELYVLELKTLRSEPLTDDPAKDFQGSWSRDGKTIYFLSDRSGRDEIWKMAASGGRRAQVTRHGGAMALESSDRRFLYYARILDDHTQSGACR